MQDETLAKVMTKPTALYCRRGKSREKLCPSRVTCWSSTTDPCGVTLVEADARGARLVLPFRARVNEVIRVCFSDSLGHCQTRQARVAWTHELTNANRVMVGLAFDEEMAA